VSLSDVAQLADRRFVRGALLPALLFVLLAGVVAAVCAHPNGGASGPLGWWQRAAPAERALAGGAFALAALLLAGAVAAGEAAVLRCAEGYWPGWLDRTLGRLGRRRHLRGAAGPAGGDGSGARRPGPADDPYRYPPATRPHEMMPTRLGNILKAAELYPRLRYGIDAVLVWPRLFHVLPESLVGMLSLARAELMGQLVYAVLAAAFAVSGGAYVLAAGGPAWMLLGCVWGGGLASWAAYRIALGRALVYGHHLRVAFDLYRGSLFEALGEPRPSGLEEERLRWEELCLFWHRGVPPGAGTAQGLPRGRAQPPDVPDRFAPSLTQLAALAGVMAGLAGALALAV
jgi:hypothetical protein